MSDEWLTKCLKAAQGDQTAFADPQEPMYPAHQATGVEVGLINNQVLLVLHQPPEPPTAIPLTEEAASNLGKTLIKASMVIALRNSGNISGKGLKDSGPSEDA